MWLNGQPNIAVTRRALGAFFRLGLIGAAPSRAKRAC
jgi:hypothetical protein